MNLSTWSRYLELSLIPSLYTGLLLSYRGCAFGTDITCSFVRFVLALHKGSLDGISVFLIAPIVPRNRLATDSVWYREYDMWGIKCYMA